MAAEDVEWVGGLAVPEADDRIVPGGGEGPAVRAEQRPRMTDRSCPRHGRSAGRTGVPQADRAVVGSRGQAAGRRG